MAFLISLVNFNHFDHSWFNFIYTITLFLVVIIIIRKTIKIITVSAIDATAAMTITIFIHINFFIVIAVFRLITFTAVTIAEVQLSSAVGNFHDIREHC